MHRAPQPQFAPGGLDAAALAVAPDLDPTLAQWLTSDGLLTERLRALPHMRLRTLAETDVTLSDRDRALTQTQDRSGRLREISLQSGDTRYVYGSSVIPASLVAAYPWLSELGDQPLGATLTGRLAVARSAFTFYRLVATEPLAQRAAGRVPEGPLWSRCSTFELPQGLILVTEVFLPPLARWPVS